MKLLREYIRELLKEDSLGFVHDLAGSDKFGDQFFGGSIGKEAGREIKRAFNNNADHQWLSTLDTVHWTGDVYGIKELKGKRKDELSATMTLPGDSFVPSVDGFTGLWIKGRITLAANDQDNLYTGFYSDYTEESDANLHRIKSSGINKRPSVSKDYSQYGRLARGNASAEMRAQEGIPYVLDQSTWDPSKNRSGVNEALVDNWRVVGVVIGPRLLKFVKYYADSDPSEAIGEIAEIFRVATDFGVPIIDVNRSELWRPE